MPREFFIAPLVCVPVTGGTTEVECAPKVNPQQLNYVAACQEHTTPYAQCLVLAAGDTTAANSDSDLVSVVAENFDTPIASLPTNVRNRIQAGLTSKGIPLDVNDYTLVRDFIQSLGEYFDPNFDVDEFWVSS